MKLTQLTTPIFEGIEVHGPSLWAYAAVVGETYGAAPVKDPRAVPAYKALVVSNQKLYTRLSGTTEVQPTQDDPYGSVEDLAQDVKTNRHLSVYSGHSDHPIFTPEENVVFRTVHDYFAHVNPNLKTVGQFKTHGFNYRGELNAYLVHARLAPREAIPVLFTEVVGQISVMVIANRFPPQKGAILDGFDYTRLGRMDQTHTNRFQEILRQLKDSTLQYVEINYEGGIRFPKARIDSRGFS